MSKVKAVRTRVWNWTGPTVPPQPNFCTNASDALFERGNAMTSFRFHQWLICEVEAESGESGIGMASAVVGANRRTCPSTSLAQS